MTQKSTYYYLFFLYEQISNSVCEVYINSLVFALAYFISNTQSLLINFLLWLHSIKIHNMPHRKDTIPFYFIFNYVLFSQYLLFYCIIFTVFFSQFLCLFFFTTNNYILFSRWLQYRMPSIYSHTCYNKV